MQISLLRELLDTRHVVYRELQQICQFDPQVTSMLNEFFYWAGTPTAEKRGGWFYKTANDLKKDIGLTRRGYEKARKYLCNIGILDYKRAGVFAKMHYRINTLKLTELICKVKGIPMPDPGITQIIDRDNFRLPSWVDLSLWHQFLDMRESKGRKVSFHSKRKHLEALKSIYNQKQDVKQQMLATITGGWTTFYPASSVHGPRSPAVAPQLTKEQIDEQIRKDRQQAQPGPNKAATNELKGILDFLSKK